MVRSLKNILRAGPVLAIIGCSGLGYQGGIIPTTFKGVIAVQAISPQSVQLTWEAYPSATTYNIYSADQNDPIYKPSFSSLIFKPSPLDPNRTYSYSVTAMDPISGSEQGVRSNYSSVQLLPHLDFKTTGSVTATGKKTMRVNWQAYPTVTYMVFVAERLATGAVNYNAFLSPRTTSIGTGTANITGLLEGREYCAIVAAAYADATNDTPNGVSFTGDIGTKLNSADYMIGNSGTFGDSVIAQSQKCVRTLSSFTVANINVYAPKASLSQQPTFYVSVPGDTNEDSTGPISTEIYQYDPASGLATQVATRIGTGKVATTSVLASGKYKFFSVINDLQGTGAQIKQEIIVGPTGSLPADESQRPWVYVRSFNQNESPTAPQGYYPEKQQAGFGSQKAGSAVAMGDFNCDGKYDVAVGISDAFSMSAVDNRPAQTGKVLVYYDVGNGTPSTSTRVQTINFDITAWAGDPGRHIRLGTSLYAGNFNADNQVSNQYGSGLVSAFHCDDLIIGSGYGPMFVVYGARDVSPGEGGLSYVNATSYTVNPSASCDPSSNVCQPAMYTSPIYTVALGRGRNLDQAANPIYTGGITSGDYNGDGFEDLAVMYGTGGVWVFRGSEFGLIAPSNYNFGNPDLVNTTPGPYQSFPYMPASAAATPWSGGANPTPAPGWPGQVLGTFPNAYYDVNPGLTKGTRRVRDALLVGNSGGAGAVIACLAKSDFTAVPSATWGDDPNETIYWDCSEKITAPTGVSGFGFTIASIKNALRYRPDQFRDLSGTCYLKNTTIPAPEGFANCQDPNTVLTGYSPIRMGYPGAVAITATGTAAGGTSGSVIVLYGVNNPTSYTPAAVPTQADRDQLGLQKNTYFSNLLKKKRYDGTTDLIVVNSNPCVASGGSERCDIQKITHPTNNSGNFGRTLAAIPGSVAADTAGNAKDTMLAVGIPNKTVVVSGGFSYTNVGSVQLYSQNSFFASNPVIVFPSQTGIATPTYDACAPDGICRYSDGFSNSLTTAIDYDGTNNSGVTFSLGGIAAGPVEAAPGSNPTTYNTNTDIFIGAPGYITSVTGSSGAPVNVIDNGAVFAYFSHSGTYRTFRVSDSGPAASPWHIMARSYGQESDIKFHQAHAIGDINSDGAEDVAVRISRGSRNLVRIYSGFSNKIGLDTGAGNYTDFQVQGDVNAGIRFVPAGKITNGSYPVFFVTSNFGSYLYFSSVSGITPGVPTPYGVGGIPRELKAPFSDYIESANAFNDKVFYLPWDDGLFYNRESLGNIDSTLNEYSPFAHGDFNGDGFEDFAIGFDTSGWGGANGAPYAGIADVSATHGCPIPGGFTKTYCGVGAPYGSGRVIIFYGGVDNGFQLQADVNGGFAMTDSNFTDYSTDNPVHSYIGAPCTTTANGAGYDVACPKAQMIGEYNTSSFGKTITSVPLGNCVLNGNVHPVSGIVVTAYNGANAKVYTYKPRCLLSGLANDFGGLTSTTLDATLPLPTPSQTSNTFGISMAAIGVGTPGSPGLMGPNTPAGIISHLVIADETRRTIVVYPVHETDGANSNFGTYTDIPNGGRLVDYSVSSFLNGASGSTVGFGSGMAPIGDINGDGFSDVAINFARVNRKDIASSRTTQGGILVLFGGVEGLQTHSNPAMTTIIEPSRTSTCYTLPGATDILSICNPTMLYLPQPTNSLRNGAYERTFLSPYSWLSTTNAANEGMGTFLMGVPGRDSLDNDPNIRILQGGAFYVLP